MSTKNFLKSEAELKLDLVSLMLLGPAAHNRGLTPGLHTGKEAKGGKVQGRRRSHIPPRRAVGYQNTRGLRLGC